MQTKHPRARQRGYPRPVDVLSYGQSWCVGRDSAMCAECEGDRGGCMAGGPRPSLTGQRCTLMILSDSLDGGVASDLLDAAGLLELAVSSPPELWVR